MGEKCPESRRFPSARGTIGALLAVLGSFVLACGVSESRGDGRGGEPPATTVEIERIEPALLRNVATIPGQLEAELTVQLTAESEGVLESIEFAEGATVEAGQVLFRLRDDEERARLGEARAQLALAEAVYRRTKLLVDRQVASEAELERVRAERDVAAARARSMEVELDRMTLKAPFDGVMGALHVAPGDRLREETLLTRIDALDRLQLLFTLPESAVGLVRTGSPVEIRVAPYPGERFPGTIYFVSPTLDAEARRLLVKAWVPNPDHRLRPGLFAEIEAEIERKPEALLVPESALVYGLEGTSVWRLDAEDRAHRVPVDLGIRQEGRVEIRRGLDPGDRIVSAGVHKVQPGAVVRAMEPPPAAGTAPVAADPDGPERSAGGGAS